MLSSIGTLGYKQAEDIPISIFTSLNKARVYIFHTLLKILYFNCYLLTFSYLIFLIYWAILPSAFKNKVLPSAITVRPFSVNLSNLMSSPDIFSLYK